MGLEIGPTISPCKYPAHGPFPRLGMTSLMASYFSLRSSYVGVWTVILYVYEFDLLRHETDALDERRSVNFYMIET